MERAVIAGKREAALEYLSPDIRYTVGARSCVVGVDAVFA
jgi:hypothetical protein